MYNSQIENLSKFAEISKNLDKIIKFTSDTFEKDELFRQIKIGKLLTKCKDEMIEENRENSIIESWVSKTDEIYKNSFDMISLYFAKNINSSTLNQIFDNLEAYRNSVDNFFENEKISIIQKWHSNLKNELLEKIETDGELLRLWNNFEEKTVLILEKSSKSEQNATLNLLNSDSKTSDITLFALKNELSTNIKSGFEKFDANLMEILISDIQEYSKALKKRNVEIQSLLYKMRIDLETEK